MFIILSSSAPQAHLFRQEKDALAKSVDVANTINRQLDQMTDAQVVSQYGIPAEYVAAFRTNVDNLITALSATAVVNFTSSMGFDR